MSALVARVRALPSWQITLTIALLTLGFLIAAQLAAEGPRVQYTTQERSPLVETALGLQAQQEALKNRILQLRQQIGDLEAQGPEGAASLRQLYTDLQQARLGAGLVALSGPGVAFRLEDAANPAGAVDDFVSAHDIRILVDELWLAGAEAIAVNGERVTVSTAVLDIGGSVLVNSAYLAQPYTITAIGPKDLYQRLQASVSFQAFVSQGVQVHRLQLSVAQPESVDVAAYAGTVSVRFGQPQPSGSATP